MGLFFPRPNTFISLLFSYWFHFLQKMKRKEDFIFRDFSFSCLVQQNILFYAVQHICIAGSETTFCKICEKCFHLGEQKLQIFLAKNTRKLFVAKFGWLIIEIRNGCRLSQILITMLALVCRTIGAWLLEWMGIPLLTQNWWNKYRLIKIYGNNINFLETTAITIRLIKRKRTNDSK